MTDYHVFQARLFAEFCQRLDQVPEGDGTLLDNTVVVWANELSTGEHSMIDLPVAIVGGGGYFRTGQYVHYGKGDVLQGYWGDQPRIGPAHNRLLTTFGRSMGLEIDRFGEESLPRASGGTISTTGRLDELVIV